jgi:hypothetical protein
MVKSDEIFRKSIQDPSGFWEDAAKAIDWYKNWDKVLDDSHELFYRWFTGGAPSTRFNALDRHVKAGRRIRSL